jgi:predicted short-subunit dehydrogenase-like oxidoreductase (DUF2520 family)
LHNALRNRYKQIKVEIVKDSGSNINKNILENSNIIFICTQDDKIKRSVKKILLLKVNLKGKIFAHTSGALSSDELHALKAKGAAIASFHPVQTFELKAKRNDHRFKNIYIAIEGDTSAKKTLSGISRKINSVPFFINKNFKTLHHICCVISSNYLITNLSFIRDIYIRKNGFKNLNFFNIYIPLIYQTLSNIKVKGIEGSLTGPIARNDLKTLEKHISELKKLYPEINDYYKFIGIKTVNIAHRKGSLNFKQAARLQKKLKSKN